MGAYLRQLRLKICVVNFKYHIICIPINQKYIKLIDGFVNNFNKYLVVIFKISNILEIYLYPCTLFSVAHFSSRHDIE